MLHSAHYPYVKQANHIKNWRKLDRNELANLYLEYENVEPERSYYFSALMCKYWSHVAYYYRTSKGLKLEPDDFAMWLAEAFFVAFKYRRWKDPSHKLYTDPHGPDKVIRQSIYSVRMKHYQQSNMDKRKLNYQVDSIERQITSFGTMAAVMDYMGVYDNSKEADICKDVINYLIDKDDVIGAITVDLICFGDTFMEYQTKSDTEVIDEDLDFTTTDTEDEELIDDVEPEPITVKKLKKISTVVYGEKFSRKKLISTLRRLDLAYTDYFSSLYDVELSVVRKAVADIKKLDKMPQQLRRVIMRKIELLSTDNTVKELLCL